MKQSIWMLSTLLIASNLMGNGVTKLVMFHNYAPSEISIVISTTSPEGEPEEIDHLPVGSYNVTLKMNHTYTLKAKSTINQRETPITVRPNTITISEQQREYTITYQHGKLKLHAGHIKQ